MRPILTLVTADILHALDPGALAATVTDLARRAGVSLKRVSRLKARVLPALT
jgi:DNA-binding IclR family transcriptional regulator